ncbi:MAG: hypothetical protein R3F34_08725 [Planctomycetota bacterium]
MRRPALLVAIAVALVATAYLFLRTGTPERTAPFAAGGARGAGERPQEGGAEPTGVGERPLGALPSESSRVAPRRDAARRSDPEPEPWPESGLDLVVLEEGTREPVAGATVSFVDPAAVGARRLFARALAGEETFPPRRVERAHVRRRRGGARARALRASVRSSASSRAPASRWGSA